VTDGGGSDIEVALRLAAMAAPVALEHFERGVQSWSKADGTVVGEADLAVDKLIAAELAKVRPGDGVLSEESDPRAGTSTRRWIIDPIDGTQEFLVGERDWGVHIALEVDGEIALGIMTRPTVGALWWAERGHGAFRRQADGTDVRLQAAQTTVLAGSRVAGWPESDEHITRLRDVGVWDGGDMAFPRFLAGEIDALFARGAPWDWAPVVVLVEEAGGTFQDLAGGRSIYQINGVASSPALAGAVETLLQPAPGPGRGRRCEASRRIP